MTEYTFKKFVSTGTRLGNYSISFNGSSYFGFNSGFYVKENINKYKKVVLFYDKKKKAVAFQFTNDQNAEGSFTVVHAQNQSTGSVTARSFVIGNDINKPRYFGKKKPIKVRDKNFGELFVINLFEIQ